MITRHFAVRSGRFYLSAYPYLTGETEPSSTTLHASEEAAVSALEEMRRKARNGNEVYILQVAEIVPFTLTEEEPLPAPAEGMVKAH